MTDKTGKGVAFPFSEELRANLAARMVLNPLHHVILGCLIIRASFVRHDWKPVEIRNLIFATSARVLSNENPSMESPSSLLLGSIESNFDVHDDFLFLFNILFGNVIPGYSYGNILLLYSTTLQNGRTRERQAHFAPGVEF